VHWHGLTPPSDQDGVPEFSQPALKAGGDYEYDFLLARPGTNWMHSHVGLQEQQLLAAPLIVRDPDDAARDEQEVVILLHDFTFRDPAEILAGLSGGMGDTGDIEGMAGMDHSMGHDASSMTAMQPHLNDIEFDAYLANDRTLNDPEIVRVEAGGRVRLRIINAASSTNFWLDLGALAGDLIAVDGHAVSPLSGNRFPLAIAQRADIRLRLPAGAGAYPVLAVREGDTARTGIILATAGAAIARVGGHAQTPTGGLDLALEQGLTATAPVPGAAMRPVRRHVLDLTGSMMGFAWGFNGRRFGEDAPLPVRRGERVEIALVNRTDMSHPIHLHGHRFQVVAINGSAVAGAMRDTVLVPLGGSVTIAFAADNPGHWALHCHNLYHMAAGMMTSIRYEG
jgi:FtsP/CotA-like multicopper oxidase with cupredoxin domain